MAGVGKVFHSFASEFLTGRLIIPNFPSFTVKKLDVERKVKGSEKLEEFVSARKKSNMKQSVNGQRAASLVKNSRGNQVSRTFCELSLLFSHICAILL